MRTLETISKELGYSLGTVSRAINNKKGVSEKTRKKILDALDEMGYQPNRLAQSLVKQHSKLIGVIVPTFANDFLGSIATIIEQTLEARGYHMILFSTNWNVEEERQKIQLALANQVDGIIIKPVSSREKHLEKVPVPLVFVSQTHKNNSNWVDIDNKKISYEATEHLIKCDYKRIAFIESVSSDITYTSRYEGYLEAIKKHGLSYSKSYKCGNSIEHGYELMKKILAEDEIPDSVFCCDDYFGAGILACVDEHGISVPNDFGIVGFNNSIISQLSRMNMTTISQPKTQLAQYAVQMIINLIEAEEPLEAQRIVLSASLIERNTTRRLQIK